MHVLMCCSGKDPYPSPQRKLTIPPPQTSYTNLKHSLDNTPPPTRTVEISSVGGVWIFFCKDPMQQLREILVTEQHTCKLSKLHHFEQKPRLRFFCCQVRIVFEHKLITINVLYCFRWNTSYLEYSSIIANNMEDGM